MEMDVYLLCPQTKSSSFLIILKYTFIKYFLSELIYPYHSLALSLPPFLSFFSKSILFDFQTPIQSLKDEMMSGCCHHCQNPQWSIIGN